MQNVLITGVSSGLGEALAQSYLERGDKVYAIGKTEPKKLQAHPHFFFFPYDLSQTFVLQADLESFVSKRSFDIVILNAGILSEIETLSQTDLADIKAVMEVNVWANKELIDLLCTHAFVKQIIGISSGASVVGMKGWGAYALSKASLNMLLSIYAKEMPEIHFTSLAPGVIQTPMTQHLVETVNESVFTSVKKLKNGALQTPQEAAKRLITLFPTLLTYESGSYLDVRDMD